MELYTPVLALLVLAAAFAIFSVMYLGEPLKWNNYVAFAMIAGAAFFSFHKWS